MKKIFKFFILGGVLFLFPFLTFSSYFVKNIGQTDGFILFYSQNDWGNLYITDKAFIFQVRENESLYKNIYLNFKKPLKKELVGEKKLSTYLNFIRDDIFLTDVPLYEEVRIKDFTPKNDLIIKVKNNQIFFDNIDENSFKENVFLDSDLECEIKDGALIINKKERIPLFLKPLEPSFREESQALFFSTYLGGSSADCLFDLTIDSSNNLIVAGNSSSSDIPVPNGYDSVYKGTEGDIYLAKFSNDYKTLLWATFLGCSSSTDAAFGVKTDSNDNIIFGGKGGKEIPTPNGISNSYSSQIFLGKISPDGRNLLFGTKLGSGSVSKIEVDQNDNIYFVAYASALLMGIQCLNGYDCSYNGGSSDLFIGKLDNNGTLLASTFLGGSGADAFEQDTEYNSFDYSNSPFISLDGFGNIVVATYTSSTSTIPIVGGYQTINKGSTDLYIAKLSNNLSTLIASTFLGGIGAERIGGLKVDNSGNIIVAAYSISPDMPVKNAFQQQIGSSNDYDGYIAKLNNNLSDLIFATYLGGSKLDFIKSLTIDGGNNILVTGTTFSPDFPTKNPIYSFSGFSHDAFVSLLSSQGNSLLEGTYFGGSNTDIGQSIIYKGGDKIFVGGRTYSKDLPLKDSYDSSYNGSTDGLIFCLSLDSLSQCKLSCSANVPTKAKPNENVSFSSNISLQPQACTSYSVLWDFGDGATSTLENPTHKYSQEGTYFWKLKVSGNNIDPCTKSGGIIITNSLCELECNTSVPPWAMINTPVNFTSSIITSQCPNPVSYFWDFGDGETSTAQNPVHVYTKKGTYTWTFKATSSPITCEKSDKIYIDTERPCVQMGYLKFCADFVEKLDDKTYRLTGNVSLNELLYFNRYITLIKNENNYGTLTIYDGVYIKNIHGSDETLVSGQANFFVDGVDKILTQYEGPALYSINLLNLPLETNGSEIRIMDDGVVVTPFLNLGVEPIIIARVQMELLFVPNDDKYIRSVEVINGQLTPSISINTFSLTYDHNNQEITGNASIGLPFLEIASLDASVQFKPGCLDGFSITIGLPQGIPLGTTGLEIDALTLEVDNLCTPARFYIFIGGDIAIQNVPSEVLVLEHMGLGYEVPFTLNIDGGTLKFLGYGLASAGGTIIVYPPLTSVYGNIDLANILIARISITLDISNLAISGNAFGAIQIPDWDCCTVCLLCKTVKALVRSVLGTLPYTFAGIDMKVKIGQTSPNIWGGDLRGMVIIKNKSFAAEIKFENGDLSFLVGTNYDNLFEIWLREEKILSPTGYEKTLELKEDKSYIIFGAAGISILPEIYVINPEGVKITKENWNQFSGVTFYESIEDLVSIIEISPAIKGNYKFGMTNLNQDEGDLFALCEHPKPNITFLSINPTSNGYSINFKVEPFDADNNVSLFYSNSPEFGNGILIKDKLTSQNGEYSVIWNTSNIPNGNYLIFARVDDGKNPLEIKYYENQLSIDKSLLVPPSNLRGVRNGAIASLSWTPSPSTNVNGYNILYTDEPETYGYKFKVSSFFSDSHSVENLDVNKTYRFAVVAYDKDGNYSLESNSIILANVQPPIINSIVKISNPFRLDVQGSNLQEGIKVYINGTEWTNIKWKSTMNIKIKGGASLKALLPKGSDNTLKFINPDGGEATYTFRY